ncbi:MAG: methyltransferase domain-containing protein [Candidatus Eremiobacteraeota bacterium]|nr:methyltransferase domain-containing protein [Candidatus Eremiobacteraeota bacterium]
MIDAVGKRAVDAALELNVFQFLGTDPREVSELALQCGVSVRGLKPLLSLLAALELLEESSGRFRLLDTTADFLKNWPVMRSSLTDAPDWQELPTVVRTGKPARDPIEGEKDGGDFFSGVVSTLFGFHLPLAKNFAAQLPPVRRVLDLGAGSAVWSLALAKEKPEVRVVAVDHGKVLEEMTTSFVEEYGVTEQYELRPGSYHEVDLEEAHYDLVYLGHVVHSEGWDASRTLLARCLQALKPGGLVGIAEWIAAEPRSADYHACLFDLNMLMFTEDGLVFNASELERLVTEAGFSDPEWVEGPGKYPVLQARR